MLTLTRRQLAALIAGVALAGFGTAALALDEANDPYWHKKPQPSATTPRQAGATTGTAKDKAAAAKAAAYEKSRAGQAEGELTRGPQHLQDKHNQ